MQLSSLRRRAPWLVLLIALVVTAGATQYLRDDTTDAGQALLDDDEVGRIFDGPLPGVAERRTTPTATGNAAADTRIRDVALARGYRLRGEPLDPMGSYQGRSLQQRAIDDLVSLQSALAADEGVSLTLTSAHRSATRQRQLFLQQLSISSLSLRGRVVSNSEIGAGLADDVLNRAMAIAAPPGFSRHHTGLVIDVSSQGLGGFAFSSSAAYRWLTENRYANALSHGWAPSYPPNASAQGPNPEPWEWVWIGRDTATCAVERTCAMGGADRITTGATAGWATTRDGTAVHALRLLTAAGAERLSAENRSRFDLVAALGVSDESVGFRAAQGAPADARWACIEARTRSGGPWSRVACVELD